MLTRTPPKKRIVQSSCCSVCKIPLSPSRSFPKCKNCSGIYHFMCLKNGPAVRRWSTWKTVEKGNWVCEFCSEPTVESGITPSNCCKRKRDSTLSPDSDSTAVGSKRLLQEQEDMDTSNITLSSIKDLMEDQFGKFKNIIINEMQARIEETLQKEISDVRKENIVLKDRITTLEKRVELLEEKQDRSEQYSKRNNLIISGIPVQPNEDVQKIVMKIAQKCDVQVPEWDIVAAHRLQTRKNGDTPIIIKFLRKKTKEELITSGKKKNLTADLFGNGRADVKLYFNEHLIDCKNQLYKKARDLRQEKIGYKFVWVRNGRIMARKNEGDPVEFINSEQDLNDIKSRYA